jgi:nucleoside-diphosphate-sugar epimerase
MSRVPDPGRRRVLVTGAGGFIGRHLVADQLSLGREVVALDLDLSPISHLRQSFPLEMVEGDVADPVLQERALRGVDTVFHLAAAHLSVTAGTSVYRRVNVDAVRSLVARSGDAGIRRFVHCSTVGVFGALRTQPADEETPCQPEFDYEKTKLEGEAVLVEAFSRDGFPMTILRPAWVYGPGCPRTEKLFRTIRRKRFLIAGAGGGYRHSVYIRDMTAAFELAANTDAALGQVLIIADDEAVTVRTLVGLISQIVGSPMPRAVPFPVLRAAGAAAEFLFGLAGKEPPVSRRSLRFFSGNTAFDTARARDVLGFRPSYGIQEGLRETFEILEQGAFWTVPLPSTPATRAG